MRALHKLVPVAMLLVLTSACGITASLRNPGYVNFDEAHYNGLRRDTSISIGPALLGVAAQHVDDDPNAQVLLAALDGVRVKVYHIDGKANLAQLVGHLNALADSMDDSWQQVVRVQEDDSTTHILIKHSSEAILGLAILAVDQEELVFVNVMGELTPAMLQELSPAIPGEQAIALRHIPLN